MRPARPIATFVMAVLIGALGIASAVAVPAAASASVPGSAQAASMTPAQASTPNVDANCPFHPDKFATFTDGCVHWTNWTCRQGNENSLSPVPDFVSNACAGNIRLYSNSNESGTSICIRGDTRTGHLNNPWRSFRMIVGGC